MFKNEVYNLFGLLLYFGCIMFKYNFYYIFMALLLKIFAIKVTATG